MSVLDLLVVGGGITGLGVARLAAHNGLSVAVLERADLGAGASSATSHMLHGGLRYLEHGQFGLVREALRERARVARLAPELARPTRFLLPFRRGDRRPPWQIGVGLTLYDAFAGRSPADPTAGGRRLAPHSRVPAAAARALEPELDSEGLKGAAIYSDIVMDDVRLAVAVARDAADHGAAIHTYTEAIAARRLPDEAIEVTAHGPDGERRLAARAIVNASGAWGDDVRRRLVTSLDPGAPDPEPILRPSRGIHLVYPSLTRGHGLLLTARADGRVWFVIPFAAWSLVGTTEVEVASPPGAGELAPTLDEVRYLRAELAAALPGPAGTPVIAATCGIRPLLAAAGGVGEASREHRVVEDGPILTVAGGKYTTFRVMARDTLARVLARRGHGVRPILDRLAPLPRPLGDGHPVERLAEFAVDSEFARRIEDVLRRRTRLWLAPDRGRVAASTVAEVMARKLGWDDPRRRLEIERYQASLADEERLLARARG
ncbi:MAG: glycerol-3-phosphate dehydrogenase/oxidase [Candidatus Eisenbacteria bacterium]|nr:glycerol-3-phosphate dehydrogenase/oxidase [Candidatus Eisenbacteria bacterium]